MANLFRCGGGKKLKEQTCVKTLTLIDRQSSEFKISSTIFTELKEIIGVTNIHIKLISCDGFPDGYLKIIRMKLLDDKSFVSINENTISFTIEYDDGDDDVTSSPVTFEVSITAIGY